MSNAVDLRVSHSLELVSRLRRTVSEFAKKEDQLSRDQQARRYQIQRRHNEAVHKADTLLASRVAELESRHQTQAERVHEIYGGRKARVERAHSILLRNLPRRAQEAKGNFLAELQRRERRAEKTLTSGSTAAEAEFTKIKTRCAEQDAEFSAFERRTRAALRGYGAFGKMAAAAPGPLSLPDDPRELFEEFRSLRATGGGQLAEFRRFAVPRIFSLAPLPVSAGAAVLAVATMAVRSGFRSPAFFLTAGIAIIAIAALFFLHRRGQADAAPAAEKLSATLVRMRAVHQTCRAAVDGWLDGEKKRLKAEFDRTGAELVQRWNRADEVEADFEGRMRAKFEAQFPRLCGAIDAKQASLLDGLDAGLSSGLGELNASAAAEKQKLTAAFDAGMAAEREAERKTWDALNADWKRSIDPIASEIASMNSATASAFPGWSARFVEEWRPPAAFMPATRFARLELDLNSRIEGVPPLTKLAYPGPPVVSIPLSLAYPAQGSVFIEDSESGSGALIGPLNNLILRLLSTTPPGKISFTIIDAVGLGQNFAGLMHLADYEEAIINRRIWTQSDQIDERLVELNAHIEKVIQMYLRNEYATITEYNEQAGSVAEKYHFLVVAGFPAGFSDTAAKRLQSIAVSGPRCGVFTLIHWDQRQPLPDGVAQEELRKTSVCLRRSGRDFIIGPEQVEAGAKLVFDPPPDPELALALVHKIGKSSVDSNRVEVPFSQIAPKPAEMWTGDTTSELRVAIGRTGATKLQYLAIGKGTRQHALFAGKTGSGKSTLFHVIITNLALTCSPDQVEFYLIDFKKGVEFKCYATKRLPHARVVAIESDREFALSVLQRVDEELKRRGDIFRKLGVQDLAGYKKAGGTEPMPRSLLLIDEFQEFFVEDDTVAQTASLLFDRIVRQGRAFGIHVLLGSQSLGGAYSLARATLGQMVIRVALQCNEADAYLIMDDTNSAPRLLSRPGEGIYNDAGGAIEGNSPFQVVWLPDDERDVWLEKVRDIAVQRHDTRPAPIVFEGNAPADIRENDLLAAALAARPAASPAGARCWRGAPNSIKGPTEAVFHRQSGNHLLIIGQSDEAALTLIGLSMLALAAQHPAGAVRFILLHTATPGTADAEFITRIRAAIPHGVEMPGAHDIPAVMNDLAATLKARLSGEQPPASAPAVFLFIHGLQKFKKLRQEDEFSFSSSDSGPSPGAQFNELIAEGSSAGIHIVAAVDTFNNLNRSMSRKALSEFEMRLVFQMSANDSASLIDSPKASTLGLHRAILYNEQSGQLETFRPYATPDATWLEQAAAQLARRPGSER